MTQNPTPRKGVTQRLFSGQPYIYAGRSVYGSKARMTALELADQGIKSRITESKDKGYLIWTDKPTYVELGEYFSSPRGYYNPKSNPSNPAPKDYLPLPYEYSSIVNRDMASSILERHGIKPYHFRFVTSKTHGIMVPTKDQLSSKIILEEAGLDMRPVYNPTRESLYSEGYVLRAIVPREMVSKKVAEFKGRGMTVAKIKFRDKSNMVAIFTKKQNPLVKVHPLAIEAKKKWKEDTKAGHGKGEEYWAGYAGAAYLLSNPGLQLPKLKSLPPDVELNQESKDIWRMSWIEPTGKHSSLAIKSDTKKGAERKARLYYRRAIALGLVKNPIALSGILPEIGSGIVTGVGIGTGWTVVDHLYKKMFNKKNPRRVK